VSVNNKNFVAPVVVYKFHHYCFCVHCDKLICTGERIANRVFHLVSVAVISRMEREKMGRQYSSGIPTSSFTFIHPRRRIVTERQKGV